MTETPTAVFLDTDIGPDCDDTAALAILLSLCRRRGLGVAGITHCTGSPYGLAAIDAICRRFDLHPPVGTCAVRGFLSSGAALRYTPAIAERCPHGFPPVWPQPDAADALIRGLSGVPEGGAMLIAIGPMINLARFLREPETSALLRAKVSRIVCMAGAFAADPLFAEWNVEMDIPAAQEVVARWPGRLDLCPFEALGDVLTGRCLEPYPDNPVSIAYRLYTEGAMLRPSWDPGTVAAALLGPGDLFEWSPPGTISVDGVGITRFAPCADGRHRWLRRVGSAADAARWIEALLSDAVADMEAQA